MVKNLNVKDLQKELQDFITKAHSDGSMDSVQLLVQDLKQRLLQYIDQRWVEDV
jgi:predicted methyltransferase